jgi:hypothetical protein
LVASVPERPEAFSIVPKSSSPWYFTNGLIMYDLILLPKPGLIMPDRKFADSVVVGASFSSTQK